MSITSSLSAEERAALASAMLRQEFNDNDPLSQLMLLSKDGERYFQVLGADWYAFTGVERLCAVMASPIPLYPLSPLEKLIAHMPSVHESYHKHELLDEFTTLREQDLRAAQVAGGFHALPVFQQCSENERLAMYQWSAWNKSLSPAFGTEGCVDIGRDIRVWDAAPAYVRHDPLMQQIVGLQRPVMLQECVRRAPHAAERLERSCRGHQFEKNRNPSAPGMVQLDEQRNLCLSDASGAWHHGPHRAPSPNNALVPVS